LVGSPEAARVGVAGGQGQRPQLSADVRPAVLQVDQQHPHRVDRLQRERVDAGGDLEGGLPQQGRFPGALGPGQPDPVSSLQQVGHQPVVVRLRLVQERLQL
jgi:hypothetical protein